MGNACWLLETVGSVFDSCTRIARMVAGYLTHIVGGSWDAIDSPHERGSFLDDFEWCDAPRCVPHDALGYTPDDVESIEDLPDDAESVEYLPDDDEAIEYIPEDDESIEDIPDDDEPIEYIPDDVPDDVERMDAPGYI
eukprot:CAMPEP_0194546496 /NCGR_PEP_ID=MMETSP0253-20130528/90747_1 /TAXON_ID=2966 /ORGANISM="Noctiluca scintillans" /LENGTH=137 /DNA_ID=CAMNT_0039393597 /DNA_START=122 /DNA_END=531 /DNA_ORIENTATION=+